MVSRSASCCGWKGEGIAAARVAFATFAIACPWKSYWPWFFHPWFVDATSPLRLKSPMEARFRLLSVLNIAGPFYVAIRLGRGRPLTSGEILWAWIGVAWITANIIGEHRWVSLSEMMVECVRLTLALAVLVWACVPQPTGPGRAWARYLGWALVECDVLAWGWLAWSGR